jgi:hypothetical protein
MFFFQGTHKQSGLEHSQNKLMGSLLKLKMMLIVIFIELNFALTIYKYYGEIISMWSMYLIKKDSIVNLIVWEVKS